jgi:predicted 3-demethylubiquinone-9 3-methyltransferase (glyoxalase superfamily)
MQKITPFLWYDDKAEEAANFYVSVFKNSKVGSVTRYEKEGAKVSGRPEGTAMTVEFHDVVVLAHQERGARYHLDNTFYSYGYGIILYSMMRHLALSPMAGR